MKLKLLRELRSHQVPNPMNSFNTGIVEIIVDDNPKALVEKLNRGVATDESGAAGHQNRLLDRPHRKERETKIDWREC